MLGPGRQERSWIRGAQGGSASDLEALFKEHWPRAHRAAYLVVQDGAAAEDIAQEAFLSAVRNLDRFDRRRPFGPWLHRIVVNRAIDWARARSLRREISETPGADDFDTGDLGTFSDGVAAGLASLSIAYLEPVSGVPSPRGLPMIVGLAVVAPVLGHASWHLYRRAVVWED